VRATGGLDDTVQHWNSETREGTGFKFYDYTAEGLIGVVREALWKFGDKEGWTQLMKNGMQQDFSWLPSAREYVRAYERAQELHG
jgi:starch synthase